MKNIQQWVEELATQGVMIAVVDGQLQIDAPNELLVPELVEQLKARRQELIDSLDDSSANTIPVLSEDVRSGPMSLSFAQERLWFLDQFESGTSLYNIPLCVRLTGPLDASALSHAVEQLVARHEILRTRIVKGTSDTPQQIITDAVPTLILKTLDDASSLDRLQRAEASMPFDLAEPLKIRITLVDIESQNDERFLLVTMHHIASDGWSVDVVVSELAELYNASVEGRTALLPELGVQYADFGTWQRAWLNAGELKDQTAYWKDQLDGAPALIDLPTDRPRPSHQSFKGSTFEFSVPDSLSQGLRRVSQENGATLYMTLLSAFNVLLYRYGAGDDIVVGSPIANRTRQETEALIGFFVNTLVLRSDLSGDPGFNELLTRVRNTTLTAFQYQDAPFEKLVEELQPDRSTSYSPLFQVMFVLQNQPASLMKMSSLTIEPVNVTNSDAKFDLTLGIQDSEHGMTGWIEYNTDLFDTVTIERMSRHLLMLLDGITKDSEQSIAHLPLIDEAEKAQLLAEANASAREYPRDKTLIDLFMQQVMQMPAAVAVIGPDERQLSYGELDAQSNRLARYLQSMGVAPGERIGIYLERGVEMLSTLLAIMKTGAVYIPMDPMFPAERLAFMASDANLKAIVTQHDLLDTVPATQCQHVVLDRMDDNYAEVSDGSLQLSTPDTPAYIIYTSGSTGKPKGVQISHQALTNFLVSMLDKPGFSRAERLLAVTTLSFDIAALELYAPLLAGGSVVIASREQSIDPSMLVERLESSHATLMQATPATWKMLLSWGWQGDEHLTALCGGEPLSRDLADKLLSRVSALWNLYGPTETTIWSSLSKVTASDSPVSVGQPVANTQLYVLDAHQQLQPKGIPGELCISGDGVADGYLNREALTKTSFIENPFDDGHGTRLYRTGDRARWASDGNLEIHGRLDDQVKLRGYRIEPGEIRALLVKQPTIADCVVIVRDDNTGGEQLVAYMVPESSQPSGADISLLRDTLGKDLPEYMIPTRWVMLEKLPLTPNGKVDRKALPEPESMGETAAETYRAPEGETEEALATIWRGVLGVQNVGRSDSFFALGGHSLKAVQVVSRVRDELSLEMPLRCVFESPSLKDMSKVIDSLKLASPESFSDELGDDEIEFTF